MREGWEIRKLGDVCDLYQPKTISTDMLVSDGKYLVYGANGIIGRYNEYNHERPEVLMTCRGATCGSINISEPFSWINGNAMVVHPKQNNLGQSFLKYLLQSIDLSCVITGAAQPQITRQSLKPVKVVVPPIAEQEKIVAELDCMTGIIEKKKQQLEELDKLAQSIFYDMFGDPITNEKGWEVKKLEEMVSASCSISYGIVQPGDGEITGVPVVRPVDLRDTYTHNVGLKLTTKEISNAYKRTILKGNELLLCVRGTTGIVSLAAKDLSGCNVSRGISPLEFNSSNNRFFMLYQFKAPSVQMIIADLTHGIALKGMNMADVRKIRLSQPPLDLQEEFAQKVEAIEKQKELVKQSIVETETLFNSRMDYWFN